MLRCEPRITLNPLVLVVRPEVPARDVREFVAHLKANPGKLNYGVGNTGGIVATQQLKSLTGIDAVQVSYRGTPQAVTDLLGGRLQFMFTDSALVKEHVAQGSLRALAVSGSGRMGAFPDLPTMSEAGVPGYGLVSWIAVFAPAGTPAPVVEALGAALRGAMQGPEADGFFRGLAMEPSPTTSAELRSFVEGEITKWGELIKAAGLPQQ